MLSWIIRLVKRVFVFGFGAVAVYVAVWKVLPFFDKRVPVAWALLATYAVMAYAAIPFIIRLVRIFFKPRHFPHYCVTPDGFASDPVNIALVGTREEVVRAMTSAGWYLADKLNFTNGLRYVTAFLRRRQYLTAPMSSLYLFGRKHDLGFQKPMAESSERRHHVRFWAVHFKGPGRFHEDVRYWQRHHRIKPGEQLLWIGSSSKDIGLALVRHNAQVTHMIDPDTDGERDLLVDDLTRARWVQATKTIAIDLPYTLHNRAWLGLRGFLRSDGKLIICELRSEQAARPSAARPRTHRAPSRSVRAR